MNEYKKAKNNNMIIGIGMVFICIKEYEAGRQCAYKTTDTLNETSLVSCLGLRPFTLKLKGETYTVNENPSQNFEHIMKDLHGGNFSISFDGADYTGLKLSSYKVTRKDNALNYCCELDFTSTDSTGGVSLE